MNVDALEPSDPWHQVTDVVRRLKISLEAISIDGWPLRSSRASAIAVAAPSVVHGFGGGADPNAAALSAAMECIERHAVFRCHIPKPSIVTPWQEVEERALWPGGFGLYDQSQYTDPAHPCAPFVATDSIEWIEVRDLFDGNKRLAPVEFIYPCASLSRRPLVRETSNGCAAHFDGTIATLAGLCELIERDALMMFWHRQPRTIAIPIDMIPVTELREELDAARALGNVVVASLDYDLGIPCFLVLTLYGDGFAYGLGCHPNAQQALGHAIREMGQGLWRWQSETDGPNWGAIVDVRAPEDHYRLYHRGPRHSVLRDILARTLRPARCADAEAVFAVPALNESSALQKLLDALGKAGLRAYACDVTSEELRGSGVRVMRTLVPGLIPLWFGFKGIRLGSVRLCGESAPGRLCNLLPHFMH